jgi:hypothetical protein
MAGPFRSGWVKPTVRVSITPLIQFTNHTNWDAFSSAAVAGWDGGALVLVKGVVVAEAVGIAVEFEHDRAV